MNPIYLGIDCGSTSVKCLAIDDRGTPLATASHTYPSYSPGDGWIEQDPESWVQPTLLAIGECLRRLPRECGVRGISFSGHMSSPVFLDRAGNPLYRCMLVGDARCEKEAAWLNLHHGPAFRAATGNRPDACFVAAKLLWFRDHCPEAYEKTHTFVFAKDYLRYRLTGELSTDPTDAGNTLLFDAQTGTWSRERIVALGLKQSIFPPILPSGAPAGGLLPEMAVQCGLEPGTPVFCGGADMACSQLGSACLAPDSLSLTLSTSGQVCVRMDEPHPAMYGKVTWHPGVEPGLGYAMGSVFSGGLALNWCYRLLYRRQAMGPADFEEMNRLAARAAQLSPGGSGMLFLPFLSGSGTPYFSPIDRGMLLGLTASTDPAPIFAAVMEGVSLHIRENVEVFRDLGLTLNRVTVAGGGTRMGPWMQTVADVLGQPLDLLRCPDTSTLGASLLALAGATESPVLPLAEKTVALRETIQPRPRATAAYEKMYPLYRQAYRSMHHLQQLRQESLGDEANE